MFTPELTLIVINATIIFIAYFLIYPKFCGSSINKITVNDCLATAIALFCAGNLYWESNQEFSILFTTVNWFWFSLLTYAVMEIPMMVWYFKKYNVLASLDP